MRARKSIAHPWILQVSTDVFAIVCAYISMYHVRFSTEWGRIIFTSVNRLLGIPRSGDLGASLEIFYVENAVRLVLFLCLTICFLYALLELYAGRRFIRRRPVGANIFVANACALLMYYAYWYLTRNDFHPRSLFVSLLMINVFYSVALRALLDVVLRWLHRFGIGEVRTVLIGSGRHAEFLERVIDRRQPHGIRVIHRIEREDDESIATLLTRIDGILADVRPELVVYVDAATPLNEVMQIVEIAGRHHAAAKILARGLDVIVYQSRIPTDMILGAPLLHFEAPARVFVHETLKRMYSTTAAFLALLVQLPIIGVIALAIRLTSPGPAMFIQDRIGRRGKMFNMYKFRTMTDHASELQAEMDEKNESGAGLFKIQDDPRITWLGKLLRRYSIDELPQLINVIRGDMALVGPRPLFPRDEDDWMSGWHAARQAGFPGITGLWQVSGRSDINFENMCVLDIYYLRNQSWILDLKIIARTFGVVFYARGAY